jgi:F0F1-type ATP synthase assembly protein I
VSSAMAEDLPPHGDPRPRPAQAARGSSGADTGWSVIGTMLSGMAVWGGAGWLLDRWLDTKVFVPVGIILGMAVAIYLVVVKYGAVDPPAGKRSGSTPGGRRSRPRTQKGQR